VEAPQQSVASLALDCAEPEAWTAEHHDQRLDARSECGKRRAGSLALPCELLQPFKDIMPHRRLIVATTEVIHNMAADV
jgi:hypothetical protein